MEEKTLVFTVEKETKNAVRYTETTELGAASIIGTLYVQKWAFPSDVPKELTVTIKG